MIIYIIGPAAGQPGCDRDLFNRAAEALRLMGHTAINPAMLPGGLTDEAVMHIQLAMLEAAEAVFVLPGMIKSEAAMLQYAHAKYRGKRVFKSINDVPREDE